MLSCGHSGSSGTRYSSFYYHQPVSSESRHETRSSPSPSTGTTANTPNIAFPGPKAQKTPIIKHPDPNSTSWKTVRSDIKQFIEENDGQTHEMVIPGVTPSIFEDIVEKWEEIPEIEGVR